MKPGMTPRESRRFVGRYTPRIDGPEKAGGKAVFLDDLARESKHPGLLHARVLRSPHPHARIRSMDTSTAEALPGVHAVLRYDDPTLAEMPWTSHAWTGVATTPRERDTLPRYFDRRVLSDRACWVGDEMGAAVAAETVAIAEEALRLIEIDWEILPFHLEPEAAAAPGAAIIHPEIDPASNTLPPDPRGDLVWEDNGYMPHGIARDVFVERGESPMDEALAAADRVIETTVDYHNPDHACLDSMGCLIHWDGDQLTCWTNAYQGDQTRLHIAQMLGLPLHRVRVILTYVGASMGRWNVGDQTFFIYTALLSRLAGRPVRFKHTRREDFHDTRQHIRWTCRLGAREDGRITAADFYGLANVGAYAEHLGCILKFIPLEIDHRNTAHIPNVRMEGYGVYTNKIPGGMLRCTGNVQFNLALCTALDMLADEMAIDPTDLAIRNFGHQWEAELPDKSLEAVVREGARRIGWEKRAAPGQGPLIDGCKKRGLGFAFHNGWHTEWEEVPRGSIQIKVRLNPDGTVILDAPFAETGCGSASCSVYSCAEALAFLGVTPDDIKWISSVDTDTGVRDCVPTDSAVSYLQSELMLLAAAQIRDKIVEFAVRRHGVESDMIDIAEGRIRIGRQPGLEMSARDFLWQEDMAPILASVNRTPDDTMTGVPFAATFAEVEVDVETGKVEVTDMVLVDDVGTVMHAAGAEAQQLGGQCLSIGEMLSEEIIYDRKTGVPLNFNFVDYKVQTMADIRDFDPVMMEVWRGVGEFGACGLGENVMTRTPAAIANGIYNAIGVRITETPFTPEKILSVLGKI